MSVAPKKIKASLAVGDDKVSIPPSVSPKNWAFVNSTTSGGQSAIPKGRGSGLMSANDVAEVAPAIACTPDEEFPVGEVNGGKGISGGLQKSTCLASATGIRPREWTSTSPSSIRMTG